MESGNGNSRFPPAVFPRRVGREKKNERPGGRELAGEVAAVTPAESGFKELKLKEVPDSDNESD